MPLPRATATAIASTLALALAGCAQLAGTPAPAAPATATAANAPAAASAAPAGRAATPPAAAAPGATPPPAPGQPPAFAVVVKDAQEIKALFSAWRKDDKLWLELRPEDLEQPFFLSPKLASGIGEARIFGGLMLASPRLVQFRRVHNQVQLLAINQQQVAAAGTPEARAVAAAISPSLLGSAVVASQPHPERKSILIDAGSLFVSDMLGLGAQLQRSFRQGYSFDARHSSVAEVRGRPDLLVVRTQQHYATASLAQPTPGAPAGAPVPSVPEGLPDARSLFIGLHYSLMKLPEQPMARRAADPRVGYFLSVRDDFSDDLARSPRQRTVHRWRLEKKDPSAELSEPVKPITFWLDRNVPLKYRATLTAGMLEWNKAFERIGFKNAVVVKQQPDDADWDTLDAGVASLRWMVNRDPSFGAIGPSHVDPRSGEILDADIGMESLSSRSVRSTRSRILGASSAADWAALMQLPAEPGTAGASAHRHADGQACEFADQAGQQLDYALDLLAARGDLDPASPEAEQFVLDYLRGVAMHEVGHTLGLRHNFRASRAYTLAQLDDPAFTAAHGIAASVMDYPGLNLPAPGVPLARHGAPFRAALGPYDYWAIEYAYKPLPAGDAAAEAAALAAIAARSSEPGLDYATDEDVFIGLDPEALQGDLGNDVLAFARRRFDIAAELLQRQRTRQLAPGADWAALRRSVAFALRDAGSAAGMLLRQIGGLRTLRDHPGAGGRDPLQAVPAEQQRAALQLLGERVLAADSLVIPASLQRRLAPDFFERSETSANLPTDYSLAGNVLELQRAVLARLMSDDLARRLQDNAAKLDAPEQALRLAELHRRLDAAVWSELDGRGDIAEPRRELQREHARRLALLVAAPAGLSRADARALLRSHVSALADRLDKASRRATLSESTRLHLQDSAESLRAALAATTLRQPG
ncbi:MAG: zinc-dependent metalloprotease [Burkholderiaceae bacterium]|nr:zinc-dependent metalloprotease [Burkholderiaceae bacterium]